MRLSKADAAGPEQPESALQAFPMAVLLASHHRDFFVFFVRDATGVGSKVTGAMVGLTGAGPTTLGSDGESSLSANVHLACSFGAT
jgi:hypothetical protein